MQEAAKGDEEDSELDVGDDEQQRDDGGGDRV
jgi:hypothetical protein